MTKYIIHPAYRTLTLKRVFKIKNNSDETHYGTLIREVSDTQAYII